MIEHVSSLASSPAPFPPALRGSRPRPVLPRLDEAESRGFESALRASLDARRPLGPVMVDAILGGNRLRPLIVREAFLAANPDGVAADDAWIAPAVAVELVHTASLAHDDLPDFDDEAERRGRPALHVGAGVPAAILAGDALLATAFAALARSQPPAISGLSVDLLARSVSVMCRGQQQDLVAGTDAAARRRANVRKSGILFAVSGALGALAAGPAVGDPLVRRMMGLGMRLGTTYQAVDDVRDGEGDHHMAAMQFRHLMRRMAVLPTLPRVEAVIRQFSSAVSVEPVEADMAVTAAP